MATYTPNYNLGKPDSSDQFGNFRQLFNDNMDIIDTISGGGGGGSNVVWNQLQVSGDKIAEITISHHKTNVFAPSHSLSVSRHLVTGTKIATLDYDGTATDIYAPTQPTKTSDLTNDSGFLTSSDVSAVAISGDYSDLLNKPSIPTKTSDLNNDSGFITSASLPTKLSDLTNDEGFISSSDISVTQIQQSGTKIATIDVDGTSTDLYAPNGQGGSTVSWNQLQVTGDKIAEITISGHKTDVYSHSITVSRFQLTGTHIADIIIDGVRNALYAQNGGGGFSALIIITDDTGKTITATKGGDSYTATETSTGHYEVTVDSLGTWTISDGTNTGTVVVSAQTTYYFSFRPNGSTVTPTDDVSIWLQCGGRSENYTTLSQVLADSTCLSALMADNNAVDYLVRSTTFATDITADSTAMSYIGLNNYCANTLLADSDWCEAICNSTYFESVLNVKVPVMTSNTTPSGVCYASSVLRDEERFQPWNAFNGSTTGNAWVSDDSDWQNPYIAYDFGSNVTILKIGVYTEHASDQTFAVDVSNDKTSNWTNIKSAFTNPTSNVWNYVLCTYGTAKRYCRLVVTLPNTSTYRNIQEVQFYGRADI